MNTAGHPIKNIVFDMGGVLMTWDAPYFATRFSDNEEDATLLHAAYFGRGEWALRDAGVITYPTMLRIAEAHLPERLWPNLHDMAAHWARYSEPIPEVNDLARHLYEQGYDLYLLSNAGTLIEEQFGRCPTRHLIKGRVVSAEEKPSCSASATGLCRRSASLSTTTQTTAQAPRWRACRRSTSRATPPRSRQRLTCHRNDKTLKRPQTALTHGESWRSAQKLIC